jgi:hypothetical protein
LQKYSICKNVFLELIGIEIMTVEEEQKKRREIGNGCVRTGARCEAFRSNERVRSTVLAHIWSKYVTTLWVRVRGRTN